MANGIDNIAVIKNLAARMDPISFELSPRISSYGAIVGSRIPLENVPIDVPKIAI